MNADATSGKRSLLLLALCVPLLAGIAALVWMFAPWPTTPAANNAATKNSKAAIPNLGGRGRNLPTPANTEETPEEDGVEPADDGGAEETPEDEPEVVNTEREIDIWLNNLAIATKAGDRRGQTLNHDMLKKARPHELVDQRVENALLNEQNAQVRIQFFAAFHEPQPKLNWALREHDKRLAKFLGTDTDYADGEVDELKVYARYLMGWFIDSDAMDTRIISLLRNVIRTEKPEWLLKLIFNEFFTMAVEHDRADVAIELRIELEGLFTRGTADAEMRENAFLLWLMHVEPRSDILIRIEQPPYEAYLYTLLRAFAPRGAGDAPEAPFMQWLREQAATITDVISLYLQGDADAERKRELILGLGAYDFPDARKLIDDGLARKDANYTDYLIALGRLSNSTGDLQRLTAAADDPEVLTAQSAIEGLRQSSMPAADAELRKVLEQGSNIGVKSQALGALLSRSDDKNELIEEYLNDNKEASLRAVAVAHVPIEDTDWLMRIVQEDPSPRVRTAALNRLGAIIPATTRKRKELRGFFLRIQTRDNSPVIRSAARKYADALED